MRSFHTALSSLSLVSGSQSSLALAFYFSFPGTYQASPLCYFKVSSKGAPTDVTPPPTASAFPAASRAATQPLLKSQHTRSAHPASSSAEPLSPSGCQLKLSY